MILVSYPLEPQPKDCVDTPEGNLESVAVVPKRMEERIASADQRFFDRATSQHVYNPWLLIHEIFCQTRRLLLVTVAVPKLIKLSIQSRRRADGSNPQ